jgi:hypothetical protein
MIISELNYLETISESPILGGDTVANDFWVGYLVSSSEFEVVKTKFVFTDETTGEVTGVAEAVSGISTDGRFVFAAASASTFPSPS